MHAPPRKLSCKVSFQAFTDLLSKEWVATTASECQLSNLSAEAKTLHHLASHAGHLLEIVGGTCGDVLRTEDKLLRDSAVWKKQGRLR